MYIELYVKAPLELITIQQICASLLLVTPLTTNGLMELSHNPLVVLNQASYTHTSVNIIIQPEQKIYKQKEIWLLGAYQ